MFGAFAALSLFVLSPPLLRPFYLREKELEPEETSESRNLRSQSIVYSYESWCVTFAAFWGSNMALPKDKKIISMH
jgi:hypothetical protein